MMGHNRIDPKQNFQRNDIFIIKRTIFWNYYLSINQIRDNL